MKKGVEKRKKEHDDMKKKRKEGRKTLKVMNDSGGDGRHPHVTPRLLPGWERNGRTRSTGDA